MLPEQLHGLLSLVDVKKDVSLLDLQAVLFAELEHFLVLVELLGLPKELHELAPVKFNVQLDLRQVVLMRYRVLQFEEGVKEQMGAVIDVPPLLAREPAASTFQMTVAVRRIELFGRSHARGV